MQEVKAIIRPERLEGTLAALHQIPELPGVTVSIVQGYGRRAGGVPGAPDYADTRMTKLEIVVSDELLKSVLTAIEGAARTGRAGDGKIFISPVRVAITIRTGQRGADAL